MTNITCIQGVDLLMDYLEGTLSADIRTAVDAHVAGCPRCVAFIASYRHTSRVMREATAGAVPAAARSALLAALRRERGRED